MTQSRKRYKIILTYSQLHGKFGHGWHRCIEPDQIPGILCNQSDIFLGGVNKNEKNIIWCAVFYFINM